MIAREKKKISRRLYSWYPVGPVRPCIPVLVHASHIGDCSSSRLQKEGKKKRKGEGEKKKRKSKEKWSGRA